jgi:hypothetical protein
MSARETRILILACGPTFSSCLCLHAQTRVRDYSRNLPSTTEKVAEYVSEWVHPAPLPLRLVQALLPTLVILPPLVGITQSLVSYTTSS